MKKLIVTFALVLLSQIGFSQDEAFKKDVLKVIEMSGAANQMKSAKTQILQMVPKEKQAAFILDFDATMPALYDKIAAIYMETYTKEDIKAMMAFYDSPVGRKINEKAGNILEKTQAAGKEWSEELQGLMTKYMQ
jgi:hypothetical protein